jgi:hypothetical protein
MKPPNNAMHLSRHRKVVFSAKHTLRPGDGERWPEGKIIAQEAQATQQWLRTGGQPEGMPPSSMQESQ